MYQEDYLLAKVGICADGHSWFGCPMPHAPAPVETMMNETAPDGPAGNESVQYRSDNSLSAERSHEAQIQGRASGKGQMGRESDARAVEKGGGWFRRRRRARERRRELRLQQQEYMQKLQEYEEQREELASDIRRLREEVFSEVERAGGMGEVRCVYEDSLRFLTNGRGEAASCWTRVWKVPEFKDYKNIRWIRSLLGYVRNSDFILLGTADCIPVILERFARQMKSLQWYLREEDLNEEVQGWAEDFYEENGLAISIQKLTGGNVFRQLKFKSGAPVCVMDFTDEEKIFAENLARGSIWIDFASVEEKSRQMSRRAPDVSYMSLKKQWGAKTKMKPVIPKCHAPSRFRLS